MAGNKTAFLKALEKGDKFAGAEDWPQAVEEYKRAVGEFPNDALAHGLLAFALLQMGREEEALQAYRRVLEISPQDLAAHEKSAEILRGLGRQEEAQAVLLTLADIYQKQGKEDEYYRTMKQAVILDPQNPQLATYLAPVSSEPEEIKRSEARYLHLARVLRGDGAMEKAEEFLQQAVELLPESTEAKKLLSTISQEPSTAPKIEEMGRARTGPVFTTLHQLQAKILEMLAEQGPSWVEKSSEREAAVAAMRQVLSLQAEGKWADALAQYEKIGDIPFAAIEVQISRGLLTALLGECAQAESLLAEMQYPLYDPAIYHVLGECYLRRAAPHDALPYLLHSLRLLDLAAASGDEVSGLEKAYDHLLSAYQERGTRILRRTAYNLAALLGSPDWENKIADMRVILRVMAGGARPIPIAQILELPRPEKFIGFLSRIQTAIYKQEYFLALEQTYRALENWSDYLPLQALLGEVLAQGGRVKEAVEKFQHLGNVYKVRGEQEKALAALNRWQSLAPQEREAQARNSPPSG